MAPRARRARLSLAAARCCALLPCGVLCACLSAEVADEGADAGLPIASPAPRPTGPAEPAPGVDVQALADYRAFRATLCQYTARCSPASLRDYPGGDLEGCLLVADCVASPQPIGEGGAMPSAACVAALDAADCHEQGWIGAAGEACGLSPLPAPAGPGAACRSDGQCLDGVCDRLPGRSGQCRRFTPPGEACTTRQLRCYPYPCATECGTEAYCAPEVGRCLALAEAGAACSDGVACRSGRCLQGRCQRMPEVGDACRPTLRCDATRGLLCIDGQCRHRGDVSEPCGPPASCRQGLACLGGTCGWATCGIAAEGEACQFACESGTYCDTSVTGSCRRCAEPSAPSLCSLAH